MDVRTLDHVNILTGDVDRTVGFLTSVLGLEDGPRPAFRSPGHWLYRNGTAVVHVSDSRRKEVTHAQDDSQGDASSGGAKGIVDHVAFRCSGYRETMERLRAMNVPVHESTIPGAGDRQVFVDGPDNVSFELIFSKEDVDRA
ncbi:MAG TPA: VOC family protein [Candidatus Elarobacter sp.]|jgi:catechol 2,3-dioxygenase-like lactoylglutathione lyase family enzyme|nr:VOC family protein [Candidatus Elarobacter sp.]